MGAGDLTFPLAVPAADLQGKHGGFHPCSIRDGAFGEQIQVHLNAIRNNARKGAEKQPDHPYFFCILLLRLR